MKKEKDERLGLSVHGSVRDHIMGTFYWYYFSASHHQSSVNRSCSPQNIIMVKQTVSLLARKKARFCPAESTQILSHYWYSYCNSNCNYRISKISSTTHSQLFRNTTYFRTYFATTTAKTKTDTARSYSDNSRNRTFQTHRNRNRNNHFTTMTSETLEKECINTIRAVSADMVQSANSGHPGAPMGCAPMAHILWSEVMNYSSSNPDWINRDRFVLSNGHACALQYAMLHLTGYETSKLEDLKNFRQLGSTTPGHPENFVTKGTLFGTMYCRSIVRQCVR